MSLSIVVRIWIPMIACKDFVPVPTLATAPKRRRVTPWQNNFMRSLPSNGVIWRRERTSLRPRPAPPRLRRVSARQSPAISAVFIGAKLGRMADHLIKAAGTETGARDVQSRVEIQCSEPDIALAAPSLDPLVIKAISFLCSDTTKRPHGRRRRPWNGCQRRQNRWQRRRLHAH